MRNVALIVMWRWARKAMSDGHGAAFPRHITINATLRIKCGAPHFMREIRPYGSVRGARSNARPYRDSHTMAQWSARYFVDLLIEGGRQGIAAATISYAEDYSPSMVDELRGMAEASRLKLEDLMLLQVRNQLRPDADAGCTSLALAGQGPIRTAGIVAQNWDNDPVLDPFTVVLARRPTGKPAIVNVTQAGLIAYIGFNAAGIGVCLNSLPAPARKLGVPHYFTVRGIYEADSLAGAVAAIRRHRTGHPGEHHAHDTTRSD